jgi:hypothetical protein
LTGLNVLNSLKRCVFEAFSLSQELEKITMSFFAARRNTEKWLSLPYVVVLQLGLRLS